jgi:predicted  nucleic acid-binding Zn-ribbon protein
MADELEDLTLLHLPAIDIKLDRVAEDVREIKTRVGILEQQYASVSTRIDNIDARLDRIEQRLDPAPVTSLG